MICYEITTNNGKVTIADSLGYSVTDDRLEYLLDFLLEAEHLEPGHFKAVYDLNDFVAPILALLSDSDLDKLFKRKFVHAKPYNLYYNQDKVFKVSRGGYKTNIYNLSQFIDKNADGVSELAKQGNARLQELWGIGIIPEKLSSPVTMIEPMLRTMDLPHFSSCPDEVVEWAETLRGQTWTEAHQLGHFEKTWDYDITGAYSSVLAELLDLRKGRWMHAKWCPSMAIYGFALADIKVTSNISPIIAAAANGSYYSPRGSWQDIISKQNIDLIKEYDLGKVEIIDGWWWLPQTDDKPLNKLINELFNYRRQHPNLAGILKRMANSIYGKFLEVFGDGTPGYFYNPVWGVTVQSEIKAKVARFIFDNHLEDNLIHISTDGVLLDKEVDPKQNLAEGMGSWRLDAVSPALVAGSSSVWFSDKRPHQITYQEAMAMIQVKPDTDNWHKSAKRRLTLGDMRVGYYKLGEKLTIQAGFSLPYEHDRDFANLPATGRELLSTHYTSKAWKA